MQELFSSADRRTVPSLKKAMSKSRGGDRDHRHQALRPEYIDGGAGEGRAAGAADLIDHDEGDIGGGELAGGKLSPSRPRARV